MNILSQVDYYVNKVTMYRLVLYVLIGLLIVGAGLSLAGIVPFSIPSLIISTLFILAVSIATNTILSLYFTTVVNPESVYITALILALLITPSSAFSDLLLTGLMVVIAISSKFVLSVNRKHIFNPAAIGVAIPAMLRLGSASWWVGTAWMFPFVVIGGFLIVRKIRRADLVITFLAITIVASALLAVVGNTSIVDALYQTIFASPIIFIATIMLTEPLTMPPTAKLQQLFSAMIAILAVPQVHIGTLYFSPEIALCIGNIFAYLVSPKYRVELKLNKVEQLSSDVYDFVYRQDKKIDFTPGQYMEWTFDHQKPDARGIRRYFTIASSPTENDLRLGIKFYPQSSTYKKALLDPTQHRTILGSQLAGDFTLSKDRNQKIVLIAGGIGITPYRSMLKYLTDTKTARDIILLYSNRLAEEIAYKEIFDEAEQVVGSKTIYTLTGINSLPMNWSGEVGRIDISMIQRTIPDYSERLFYISGPQPMIDATKQVLFQLNVAKDKIKTDYFSGL